ncbi:MAG TPA: hypothetical protein PLY87_10005 [Planctomycetaceae bacterium]|nr:hypothetical protein [Planctomycetaceae bacterium]HQZ65400.1 hypothetical protein [Planctomycetaceae bacterium]
MRKKQHKPLSLTDQIRAALENCGETRYRVAKNSGLNEPQLCRFVAGQGLSLPALDALAEYLGLEIVVRSHTTVESSSTN